MTQAHGQAHHRDLPPFVATALTITGSASRRRAIALTLKPAKAGARKPSTRPATWRLAWYRRGGWLLTVLDLPGLRATFCLGDLQLGSLLILERDLACDIAVQVNPRRADLERAPIGHATGIDLQCALDHAWLKLWVLGDDVFAGTDFERPTQFVRS
jgi:hypothetical protein